MFYSILLTTFLIPFAAAEIINKVGLPCDPPPVPQFLPDAGYGTYCRFNASYSQIDISFIIDVSDPANDFHLNNLQSILSSSLELFHGKYGPANIDVAFIVSSNVSKVVIPFGNISDFAGINKSFHSIKNWTNLFPSNELNLTAAFEKAEENFDFTNNRPKIIILVTSILNVDANDGGDILAENLKLKGIKIFGIAFSTTGIFNKNTYLSEIVTPGWLKLITLTANNDSTLFSTYSNIIRQASCYCITGTQFCVMLAVENSLTGDTVAEFYADCLYNIDGDNYNESETYEAAKYECKSNYTVNSRVVGLNTSLKYEFVKNLLRENNKTYWTGKNGLEWDNYHNSSVLPVEYLPDDNETAKIICEKELNISSGPGGVLTPYNKSILYCSSKLTSSNLPLCEAKAIDSYDNKALCPGPYINADIRPIQVGHKCALNLPNAWLDIIVVVDISNHITVDDLNAVSKSLMESFVKLNLHLNSKHSSRIALITYSSIPKIQFKFGEALSVDDLMIKMNLAKYRKNFDSNRNSKSAFVTAKGLLLSNATYRRPVIVFVSSGFKASQNPADSANILKSLFNAAIISVSTSINPENIDNLSTYGFNLTLNDQLSDSFKFTVTQANCYCPSNLKQFIHTDSTTTPKVTYYGECFFGSNVQKSVDDAFHICSQKKSTPVIITNSIKAAFITNQIIPSEINSSPTFSLGLKRHYENINVQMWHEYLQDGFALGTYPPKLVQFNDINKNCSMAVQVGVKDIAVVPIPCDSAKIPYICQMKAYDVNNLNL